MFPRQRAKFVLVVDGIRIAQQGIEFLLPLDQIVQFGLDRRIHRLIVAKVEQATRGFQQFGIAVVVSLAQYCRGIVDQFVG